MALHYCGGAINIDDQTGQTITLNLAIDPQAAEEMIVTDLQREFPELYQMLIVSRNQAWLPQIEALLETAETEFVLVGAGHLINILVRHHLASGFWGWAGATASCRKGMRAASSLAGRAPGRNAHRQAVT